MKRQLVLAIALGVVATVSLTTAVHALTVQINGTTIATDAGDPLTVTLSNADGTAKPQGCFTVEALDKTLASPLNRARVQVIDSAPDMLRITNVWIKATSACLTEIFAWHTFSQADGVPTTSGNSGIRFKRDVSANAVKPSGAPASGDEMWTTGWVPNTTINEIGLSFHRQFPANDSNFNNSQVEDCVEPACTITGQRDMKSWLKFNLKQTNQIKLTALTVYTSTVSGGEDTPLPEGAELSPYESFKDDKPCKGKNRSGKGDEKKKKGCKEHEEKDREGKGHEKKDNDDHKGE